MKKAIWIFAAVALTSAATNAHAQQQLSLPNGIGKNPCVKKILQDPNNPFWETPTGQWALKDMNNFVRTLRTMAALCPH